MPLKENISSINRLIIDCNDICREIILGKADEEFDSISIYIITEDENKIVLQIDAEDNISGIKELAIYINSNLKKTYTYKSKINSVSQIFEISIENIPFYSECYVIGTDNNDNVLSSDIISINTSYINNLTDLLKFKELQNNNKADFDGKNLYLLNDIDLSNSYTDEVTSWEPISSMTNPFRGKFYGNSHIISNLKITSSSNYQGFFGQNNGTINGLTINGTINASSGRNIGAIVGRNYGTITYCKSMVNISGSARQVGGITGTSTQGVITNCINYNSISGKSYIGGICGYSQYSYFENCGNEVNATINNTTESSGGIVRILRKSKIR